jgi:hypothetical protein
MQDAEVIIGKSFSLPGRCACCLAPTELTYPDTISLGRGFAFRYRLRLPACARCRSWRMWGVALGIATVVVSAAAGLALGVMLFPVGSMRVVPLLAAVAVGGGVFMAARRALHPRGHVPRCSPIAQAKIDPRAPDSRDLRVLFANQEFASLWRKANPS